MRLTPKTRTARADAGLSAEQKLAVNARPGPLMVLAGAGSGKTRVLTHRVAHLIATRRIEASSVLAITFTNRAAEEMAQRVAMLVEPSAVAQMTIGTFHSICHRILRPHAPLIGRSPSFSIYDEVDSRRALARALERCGSQLGVREAGRAIGLAKSRLLDIDAMRELDRNHYADELAEVWREYEQLLDDADALDFDDLIASTVALLRTDGEVGRELRRRYRLVLVDEFQDTSPAQYEFLAELRTQKQNVTVVGDDDQAIYGFRGADPRGVERFERDFAQAKVIKLERNYRSTPQIADAAGRLVGHNRRRKPKRIWSGQADGPEVAVEHHSDETQEARAAARWCRSLVDTGIEPARIAVLYRTQRHGRAVEQALVVSGIPYLVLGGRGFLEHREVRDALSYLALAANPHDLIALARAIAAPRRGIAQGGIEAIRTHAECSGETLVAACGNATEVERLNRPQRTAACAFADVMARVSAAHTPSEAVICAVGGSGLADELRQQGREGAERLERLRDLVRAARAYEQVAETATLSEFLAQARLVAGQSQTALGVTLSTVHSAKGLEWECVRLVGLEEGSFPHYRSLASGNAEEERRLGYVAITRARKRLVLSWSQRRHGRPATRSRFIDEAQAA